MSATKKPEKLTTEEQIKVLRYAEKVQHLSEKLLDTLVSETEGLPGTERWFIMSRVIMGLFGHHFQLAVQPVMAEMAKREKAAQAAPPPQETL